MGMGLISRTENKINTMILRKRMILMI